MSMLPGKKRSEHARERWSNDYYVEPAWCVRKLFDTVEFSGSIYDPCCGSGTIPKVAQEYGYRFYASDIVYRGFGFGEIDFFKTKFKYVNIVSNPPYNLGEDFIHHALKIADRKVAVIMRLPFLAGQRRLDKLYKIHPPAEVIIMSKRPSMPPGDTNVPAKGGTTDYAWICWDRSYKGKTILKWA